ncbi:TPA: hypothetical protein L4605_002390 [Pseudomonas aeruginosa]|uniref:DUF5677 domain-containing protein n=1 Tax=Pseudomonas aeruginosa TaxID=287 RepID=UPI000F536B67|nr:DUF5677 domain-containing protein [Pseudomonas aeruginosa]MBI7131011.1 hypothetical protein [Pseudomonas aeruginosa]MBI8616133.1 hypothetical protein [Pseudomonas aeruginosa]MBU5921472.1 hypothetical protein [Pseudomonas aeruginosa]MBU5954119.1 hypothetical protein [Pseudomonas aeruginosa]MBX5819066.1 hypothetical protein [Pseudomonas aeruginosa]
MLEAEDFFDIAESMLHAAQYTEWTGEALSCLEDGDFIFKRTTEMLAENVSAIRLLTSNGLIRPAFSTLRTTIDLVASFCWLCQKPDDRRVAYLGCEQKAQKTMKALGWEVEYEKFYRLLSKFTHGDFRLNHFYKIVFELDEVSSDISPNAEYMLTDTESGRALQIIEDMSSETLSQEYGHFIALKTFDYVLAMLLSGSGPYSDSHVWWPGKTFMHEFDVFACELASSTQLLWLQEKTKLAVYRVSGWYK